MKYEFKNYRLIVGVLFSLLFIVSSCDDDDDTVDPPADVVRFDNITLTGEAEVQPEPVITDGTGTLNATYDMETKVISYNITWTLGNEEDNTTGMHFHGPASLTESAPIILGITLPGGSGGGGGYDDEGYRSGNSNAGSVSGKTRPLTQAEEDDLLNGLWYLNIHSTTYPAGELRGQLD